jgi:hypothetical protein
VKSFRRPSPALVISLIALFVSLSGVSYGVATGFIDSRELKNNQVRSVDLRNNDVRTRDLRNNEVRGIDIRNSTVQGRDVALNTLTGDDVNESRLGKVPSAAAADTATSATTAGSAQNVRVIAPISLARGGAPVTLATHGPLTIALRCFQDMGGTSVWVTAASTTDNSSALGIEPGETALGDSDLDAGDMPVPAVALTDPAGGGRTGFASGLVVAAANGQALSGQLSVLADQDGATCSAQGHLVLAG